jgi:hypothetical protein
MNDKYSFDFSKQKPQFSDPLGTKSKYTWQELTQSKKELLDSVREPVLPYVINN